MIIYLKTKKDLNDRLLIEGRGQFILSKKVMLIDSKINLHYEIKHKLGGSIESISGENSFTYQFHHKKVCSN